MKQLKALVLDIETSPIRAWVWGTRDQQISIPQIDRDSFVMAWSAKWVKDPASKIIYRDQRHARNIANDKPILQPLRELLDEAEIVITQNGQSFDGPRINARFMLQGIKPPSPYRHFDTYRLVRRVAQFTSNKLEYLTEHLNTKYKKLSHKKYPGFSLWTECMKGNMDAWHEMEKYNKHDVLSTTELFVNLRAWAPEYMPRIFVISDPSRECATCGKTKLQARGYAVTKTARFHRYQCTACGSWQRGEKVKGVL
jgi:DNA polymerase elongation subunit (family B)